MALRLAWSLLTSLTASVQKITNISLSLSLARLGGSASEMQVCPKHMPLNHPLVVSPGGLVGITIPLQASEISAEFAEDYPDRH